MDKNYATFQKELLGEIEESMLQLSDCTKSNEAGKVLIDKLITQVRDFQNNIAREEFNIHDETRFNDDTIKSSPLQQQLNDLIEKHNVIENINKYGQANTQENNLENAGTCVIDGVYYDEHGSVPVEPESNGSPETLSDNFQYTATIHYKSSKTPEISHLETSIGTGHEDIANKFQNMTLLPWQAHVSSINSNSDNFLYTPKTTSTSEQIETALENHGLNVISGTINSGDQKTEIIGVSVSEIEALPQEQLNGLLNEIYEASDHTVVAKLDIGQAPAVTLGNNL